MPIARCTSSYSCKVELARRPNAGISYAGLHTACLTAAVDFDRPVKLLLVRAQEFLLPPIAVRAPRRSSRPANVTRLLPTQGPHIASTACLTAAVDFDRPVKLLLVRAQEFLLPPIAVRAPRRSSRPANVTRLLPTQGPHIASSTAAVEIDRPVAHVLTRRHEEQNTQHMPSGRALRDVQSHRGSRTNGGGEREKLLICVWCL